MPVRNDLGKRMKENYEQIPKTKLMRRTPVAIRIDGKAFHTFTRGFKKPFDSVLVKSMQDTMKYLCENIQGAIFGYTQSDEITLILVDYKNLNSDAWFDYEVQKVCSISASMATMAFNKAFKKRLTEDKMNYRCSFVPQSVEIQQEMTKYYETLEAAAEKGAMFDARCFNIPKEEVTNLVFWRQLDAARNSVEMVGRAYFSDKELFKKKCSDIQDMLHDKYNVNWNDYPAYLKRGSACVKAEDGGWRVDLDMPMLKGDARTYLDSLVFVGE